MSVFEQVASGRLAPGDAGSDYWPRAALDPRAPATRSALYTSSLRSSLARSLGALDHPALLASLLPLGTDPPPALVELASLSPAVRAHVLCRCESSRVMAALALRLAAASGDAPALLLSACVEGSSWLRDAALEGLADLRCALLAPPPNAAALRALCGLHGFLGAPASRDEVAGVVGALVAACEARDAESALVCVWYVLLCRDLPKLSVRDIVAQALAQAAQSPLPRLRAALLLVAVLFHTGQTQAVADMVSAKLGFQATINSSSILHIGDIIRQEVFTEDVCCRQACSIPITPETGPEGTNSMLLCIYHLLKKGVFSRCKVDIGKWVCEQILTAELPLNMHWPCVIRLLVTATVHSTFPLTLVTEETARAVFGLPAAPPRRATATGVLLPAPTIGLGAKLRAKSAAPAAAQQQQQQRAYGPAARSLVVFMILELNEQLRALVVAQMQQQQPLSTLQPYAMDLLWDLPVSDVVGEARARDREFACLREPLTALAASQLPQLFDPELLLMADDGDSPASNDPDDPMTSLRETAGEPPAAQRLCFAALPSPDELCPLLEAVEAAPSDSITSYSAVLLDNILPVCLAKIHESEYQSSIEVFCRIWERVFCRCPWEVGLATLNKLSSSQTSSAGVQRSVQYTHTDLVLDPLSVLKVVAPVLRSRLMKLVLRVLSNYITASRKFIQTQILQMPPGVVVDELNTLMLSQDSAVVQALLELCDPGHPAFAGLKIPEGVLGDVTVAICQFLHQQFIEAPLLLKLVIFQGFSTSVVPVVVERVPSMHVCLDFLPELLAQPQSEKQLFASLDVAKAALARVHGFLASGELGVGAVTLTPAEYAARAAPGVLQLCAAFPFLAEEATAVLGPALLRPPPK
eukprot:m51a1_g12193 hypothetical protein (868) ;mRNA; r:25369-29921